MTETPKTLNAAQPENASPMFSGAATGCTDGLKVLDLFSGIGGFSLGLERAGMRTVAFCEIDPEARKVLRKHWPNVPIFEDIKEVKNVAADVVCGGFPCQDISTAGKQAGLEGERSGLWFEMLRVIGETKPKWAIIENVANLRSNGLVTVLQGLWQIGYDAEWHIIPACAVGAPHKRERIWIIAYRDGLRMEGAGAELEAARVDQCARSDWQTAKPGAMRVDDGVSAGVHRNRIKQIGNAVVPQIPELIGRAITECG